jgi:hypothetical protein
LTIGPVQVLTKPSFIRENGAPGEIRTPGLLVRSQTLYPAELRALREVKNNNMAERLPPDVCGSDRFLPFLKFPVHFPVHR